MKNQSAKLLIKPDGSEGAKCMVPRNKVPVFQRDGFRG